MKKSGYVILTKRLKIFSHSTSESRNIEIKPALTKVRKLMKHIDFKDIPLKKKLFSEDVYEELAKNTFDVWKYTEDELLHLMGQMFIRMDLVEHFQIDETKLKNFLIVVRSCYNKNPFHNFKHSFCVTHMV